MNCVLCTKDAETKMKVWSMWHQRYHERRSTENRTRFRDWFYGFRAVGFTWRQIPLCEKCARRIVRRACAILDHRKMRFSRREDHAHFFQLAIIRLLCEHIIEKLSSQREPA